jgi:membrane-bound lytic murein transglycosylase D
MQILSSISKYLILALISCSLLLITWNSVTIESLGLGFIYTTEMTTTDAKDAKNSIWNSMRAEFTLDHRTQTAQVQREIRRLVADQDHLYQILKAAGPYMYFIYKKTQAKGLPIELALIPFVESEFNPNDRSSKGATGLWQLMSPTAKDLGVKVKSGYDGRLNVIASTNAALAFFNDLGNTFKGNWELAIAAYNCGPGCVQSAKRRSGSDNFWKLPLPQETKYYVPRLLAVAEIIEHPKKYGVELPPISNEPYFQEVKVEKPTSLEKVAKTSGIDIKTLKKLNPDAKHETPVQKNGESKLLVPVKQAPAVTQKIA